MNQNKMIHTSGDFSQEEVRLANRNPGMALELMAEDITPVGMHYQLNHFDIPLIDEKTWTLEVNGLVRNTLKLSLEALKALPKHEMIVTLECAGNGRANYEKRKQSMPWFNEAVGNARWSGVRLTEVLSESGWEDSVSEVVFTGADQGLDHGIMHYFARSLKLEKALHPDTLLAYEMNGQPLPVQHGYPLRLIVPGWYGVASVKWLKSIELMDHPFDGYQQAVNYHYRQNPDEPGKPVDEMKLKSLIIPPGIPDWYTRKRFLNQGKVQLSGRAWSGQGRLEKVEIGIDGIWKEASLGKELGRYAWRQWFFEWDAEPGEHIIQSRAFDQDGNYQPDEPEWDESGFGNNMLHSIRVHVDDGEF